MRNTENTITGGFVGDGRCGNVTTIKCEETGYNHFSGIQAEPGPGSRYFDVDEHSLWNTILGHDNCDNPSISRDPGFVFMSSGQLHLGNFNTSVGLVPKYTTNPSNSSAGASCSLHRGIETPTCSIKGTRALTVEGTAFIRTLEHGFPLRKLAKTEVEAPVVEVVEDGPVLLTDTEASELHIDGLRLAASADEQAIISAAFYDIALSGVGVGSDGVPVAYQAKLMATPYTLGGVSGLALSPTIESSAGVLDVRAENSSVVVELAPAQRARELVVEMRRVGRQCAPAVVSLKADDASAGRSVNTSLSNLV